MFSTELSIDLNEQAGAWLNEHDSVTWTYPVSVDS